MPLPEPDGQQTEREWISHCMGHPKMLSEFPDQKQRAGVCYSMWDDHMKSHAVVGDRLHKILLAPWGEVQSKNGNFIINEESANAIIAAFDANKKDIPIDYEHQTLGGKWASPDGKAPAAGWITKIIVEPNVGLFALVKWNEAAQKMIRADEYRYLSPVVTYRLKDKMALEITSAGLTNTPAIVDMRRVAAKAGDQTMDLKELKAALIAAGVKLVDDAADELILEEAIKQLAVKPETPDLSPIANKLGLSKESDVATIAAKVDGMLKETVPSSEYKVVVDRLAVIEQKEKDRESQTLVAKAIEEGKLNPHDAKQMEWARAYSKSDPVGFAKCAEVMTVIASPDRIVKPSDKLDGKDSRESVIQAAKTEFASASNRLAGLRQDSWINQSLREKNMVLLTDAEKKALSV